MQNKAVKMTLGMAQVTVVAVVPVWRGSVLLTRVSLYIFIQVSLNESVVAPLPMCIPCVFAHRMTTDEKRGDTQVTGCRFNVDDDLLSTGDACGKRVGPPFTTLSLMFRSYPVIGC